MFSRRLALGAAVAVAALLLSLTACQFGDDPPAPAPRPVDPAKVRALEDRYKAAGFIVVPGSVKSSGAATYRMQIMLGCSDNRARTATTEPGPGTRVRITVQTHPDPDTTVTRHYKLDRPPADPAAAGLCG